MCECTHMIARTHTSIILTGTLTLTRTDQAMTVVAATAATVRSTATDQTTARRAATVRK